MRTINDLRNKTAGMYRIAYQNIAAVRRNPLNLWVERASKRREKGGGPASGYCPALPQHPLPVNRDHLPALEGLQEHIHGAAPTTKERDQDVTAHGASTLGVHRPALIRTKVLSHARLRRRSIHRQALGTLACRWQSEGEISVMPTTPPPQKNPTQTWLYAPPVGASVGDETRFAASSLALCAFCLAFLP
jgi:hypothetical protein